MKNSKSPRQSSIPDQGIHGDARGQDQPTDKARAQQTSSREEISGERAQRDAAITQPQSPGQPDDGE